MWRILAFSGLAVAAALCNCKSRDTAYLKHDANAPIRSNDHWQWLELSLEQYQQVVAPSYNIDPGNIISDLSNPMVSRVNFWIQQIDTDLRRRHPSELSHVPVPHGIVVKDSDANAFVSGVSICIDIPTRVNPELPVSDDTIIPAIELTTDGFSRPDNDDSPCIHKNLDMKEIQAIIDWFNRNNETCKMRLDEEHGKKLLVISENCKQDFSLTGVSKANLSRFTVTNNWITVNTGLFSQFPEYEWMLLPTIAHELGHYYRSHMTAFDSEYGFYYKIGGTNPNGKPIPDKSLSGLGQQVSAAQRLSEMAAPIPRQIYHPGVFIVANTLIRSICSRKSRDCVDACADIDDKITNGYWADKFRDYPDQPIDKKNLRTMVEYETKLESCAKNISIVSGFERRGIANRELNVAISDFSSLISPPRASTFLDLIKFVSNQLREAQSKAGEIVEAAELDGLAKYTTENEADEFGLEQFVNLGFKVSNWIEADFIFNRDPDASDADKESFAECFAAYNRGWKTTQGLEFLPPRGGFYDPHPNACFRSVNMSREAKAHNYDNLPNRQPPKSLGERDWKKIHQLANDTHAVEDEPTRARRVHFVHPWKNPLYGCYYRRQRSY